MRETHWIFKNTSNPCWLSIVFRCHGKETDEADLRLDLLGAQFTDNAAAETWHDVLNKLNLGEMPPEGEKQPTPKQLGRLVDWLTLELKKAALRKRSTGGHVVLRRLTRYEYNNTMRDLLGIDLDFAKDLPPEPSSEAGFRNSGAALGMSPLQIELYLQAARAGLAKAIVTGPEPEVFRQRAEKSSAGRRKKKAPTSNNVTPDTRFLLRLLEYPREGEFVVRVTAGAIIPEGAGYPRMRLTCGMRSDVLTAEEELGATDVTASVDDPQVYEFRGRIEEFPLPGSQSQIPRRDDHRLERLRGPDGKAKAAEAKTAQTTQRSSSSRKSATLPPSLSSPLSLKARSFEAGRLKATLAFFFRVARTTSSPTFAEWSSALPRGPFAGPSP